MQYNFTLEYVAIAIMMILMLVFGGKKLNGIISSKSYYILTVVVFLNAVACMIVFRVNACAEMFVPAALYIINLTFCLLHAFITPVFATYVLQLANINVNPPKRRAALLMPYMIVAALTLSSPLTKAIFYVDENNKCCFGKLYPLMYVLAYGYLIFSVAIAVVFRKRLGKPKFVSVLVYVLVTLTAQIFQTIYPQLILVPFATAVCIVVIYYNVQNPDEYFDNTTAFRKDAFFGIAKSFYDYEEKFRIISVRIHFIGDLYRSFGDERVDSLLKLVVSELRSLSHNGMVFRASNETFMVKIDGDDENNSAEMIERLERRFKKRWKCSDASAHLHASFGLIKCPSDAENIGELADLINFMCESDAEAGDVIHSKSFEKVKQNRKILNAVKEAVRNGSFKVYYQPIYSVDSKRITAAEALIRLYDEELGFISPDVFIPLAEKEGYIIRIGRFVFEQVCSFIEKNDLPKMGIEYIEVNLSAVQCMQYSLADDFLNIMKEHSIDPSQVNFELTETSAIISCRSVDRNIKVFNEQGIPLSLDDYGTGYSNISYIYNIPFKYIKVDKGILWSAMKNEKAFITLKNVVDMSKQLGMKLIVEGVETAEQVAMLRGLGCDYFQGYYFSKAVSGDEFISYINGFELPACCM